MIGLQKLIEEDPALKLERSDETHQTILWGMGDAHLDVVLERLKRKFSVEVDEVPFKVPYRSTFRSKGEGLGRHVKQSGGHGQYGIANIRVEPLERGAGFEFKDSIFGGSIPNQWIPSVEKGVRAAMENGIGTGFPMIDIRVELYDGKFHSVDSSDMAFQMAGSMGLRDAADKVGVTLLEPIWSLDVMVPEEFTGDIMGDLQKRRGIPEGIDTVGGGRQIVKAKVPFGEVTHYATDLRSMTGGKGTFSWSFSHYQEVPHDLTQKILDAAKAQKEEAKA
jgi:elongation factor G